MNYVIEKIDIKTVNLNPSNPRKITDEQFAKLKASIQRVPKMLQFRPLILNDRNQVIGGNMRLLAMISLGFKDAYVVKAADLTEEEIRQIIILDNVSFGMWDYDMLGNTGYEHDELVSWGMPDFDIGSDSASPSGKDAKDGDALGKGEDVDKKPTITITFKTAGQLANAREEIEQVIAKYKGATVAVATEE